MTEAAFSTRFEPSQLTKKGRKAQNKKGDKLTPAVGQFASFPVPLHLGGDRCSHGCEYCFSVLAKPERWLDMGAVMRLIEQCGDRGTLEAYLLRSGYPVLMSNVTDPFAKNMWQKTLQILAAMKEKNIPSYFQTKGGWGIDEALKLVKPSVWYISISMLRDSIREQVEPYAPSIPSRFALIEKLVAQGHSVGVGVNPCEIEWIGEDYLDLLCQLKRLGVKAVFLQSLHFNSNQTRNITPKGRQALGKDVMHRAFHLTKNPTNWNFLQKVKQAAKDIGLPVHTLGQPERTAAFDHFYIHYPKLFAFNQEWVNHCAKKKRSGDRLYFREYADFMCSRLPSGIWQTGHYLCNSSFELCGQYGRESPDGKWNHNKTYRDVLQLAWNDPRFSISPGNIACFAYGVSARTGNYLADGEPVMIPEAPEAFKRGGSAVMVYCGEKGSDSEDIVVDD